MRRSVTILALGASTLALAGCLAAPPQTPEQQYVAEALRILDDAGATWPDSVPAGADREAAMLEFGQAMCTALEGPSDSELDGDFGFVGGMLDGLFTNVAPAMIAQAWQIEEAPAREVLELSTTHLCPELT